MNANYRLWMQRVTDEEVKKELSDMDEKRIADAFYKELDFGTAGLRGELGAGTNRLNIYTVRKITAGLCLYLKKRDGKRVAVSYDCRHGSELFARTAAAVFAAAGLECYLTAALMPTPFLSFITRELHCDAGVMITASHNPAAYNGYKVYGSDGCQLSDDPAAEVKAYIASVDPFEVAADYEAGLRSGGIKIVPDSLTERYLAKVSENGRGNARGLRIAYTPLNGTGYLLIPRMLRSLGAEVEVVAEQGMPDGDFPTCPYPNPEKREAMALALKLAKNIDADIVIGTDPDADRMGMGIRDNGGYRLLTGNETGALLTEYLLHTKTADGVMPQNPVLVKTIVTTDLAAKIAAAYGCETVEVLTGFKYIGGVVGDLEKRGRAKDFILGFEESYGYLAGTYVRDKDAVLAAMLAAEMAAYYRDEGKTLFEVLQELYARYGSYRHVTKSYRFEGAAGSLEMLKLLASMRAAEITELADSLVVRRVDYLQQIHLALPKADVLDFTAANGTRLIVRPSGTEPLLKVYVTACGSDEENERTINAVLNFTDRMFAQ